MATTGEKSTQRSIAGNTLRAGVLGANDGLVSNFSLVMGVAGSEAGRTPILVAGLAGMVAGALSMALGEWLSVQSAREMYAHQLAHEAREILESPDEETEELTVIYESKGIPRPHAQLLAHRIVRGDPQIALDVMAREELGIDPNDLGGSAWAAAFTSFVLFGLGALVPVLPFLVLTGTGAIIGASILSAVTLFVTGALVTGFTGRHPVRSGTRQLLFGLAAAAVTFGIGRVVGLTLR